ncbi:MAG: hypothetical protein IPH76_18960 [Xanthomonadales bacterium]|nr:hypothetical protein [Xanthomonadales bacterium]
MASAADHGPGPGDTDRSTAPASGSYAWLGGRYRQHLDQRPISPTINPPAARTASTLRFQHDDDEQNTATSC